VKSPFRIQEMNASRRRKWLVTILRRKIIRSKKAGEQHDA
jgi:hypothetical protein